MSAGVPCALAMSRAARTFATISGDFHFAIFEASITALVIALK